LDKKNLPKQEPHFAWRIVLNPFLSNNREDMPKARTKGAETRAKMVDATARLLQKKGYNGTGLSQIIKESGTPKGSLYFHFPGGKEELTAEALAASGADFAMRMLPKWRPDIGVPEAFELACSVMAQELIDSDFEHGCPIATVALEASTSSEEIRNVCARQFGLWQNLIKALLHTHGMKEPESDVVACTALSALEGALILSRVRRSTDPIIQAGEQMGIYITHLLNERSAETS
jgi:TetR/AcrR family transcriptional repressor of lmrAB and yxaGH operons